MLWRWQWYHRQIRFWQQQIAKQCWRVMRYLFVVRLCVCDRLYASQTTAQSFAILFDMKRWQQVVRSSQREHRCRYTENVANQSSGRHLSYRAMQVSHMHMITRWSWHMWCLGCIAYNIVQERTDISNAISIGICCVVQQFVIWSRICYT